MRTMLRTLGFEDLLLVGPTRPHPESTRPVQACGLASLNLQRRATQEMLGHRGTARAHHLTKSSLTPQTDHLPPGLVLSPRPKIFPRFSPHPLRETKAGGR
jgi:hypothetical protein